MPNTTARRRHASAAPAPRQARRRLRRLGHKTLDHAQILAHHPAEKLDTSHLDKAERSDLRAWNRSFEGHLRATDALLAFSDLDQYR